MSVLNLKPSLSPVAAIALARELFGVEGSAEPLPGERDQNVRIDALDGRSFVLKIANATEEAGFLEAQHLAMAAAGPICATPVPSIAGRLIETVDISGHPHLVRLLTWLDGEPMGSVARRSQALLESFGRAVARLDAGLAHVDHPSIHRDFPWDLAVAPRVLTAGPAPADADARAFIAHALTLHADQVAPRAGRLRQQAIHNDANDYNVLVGGGDDVYTRRQSVVGLLDFGDMVWSARVHDLAVAAAYALLGQDEALAAIAAVARGYHQVLPLDADELAALFPLVLLRLALSVHHAALQTAVRPDDPYLAISQAPIRAAVPALIATHPRLAHYVLRHACGLAPVPHAPAIVAWLQGHRAEFVPILGRDLGAAGAAVPLDLSAGSALVTSDPAGNAPQPMGERLANAVARAGRRGGRRGRRDRRRRLRRGAGALHGAGLPGRQRAGRVADRAPRRGPHGAARAPRSAHRWTVVVHGFEDAAARLDYGPVIVLRHEQAGVPFFTLYGHLSRASLEGLHIGQAVARGDRIGWIGAPPDNGDWWPHLHFQIVTDMLDVPCNVNGSARPGQRDVWKGLCPDPNLVLGVPGGQLPHRRSTSSLLASRRAHVGANVRLSYREPLRIVRGWMQYLFDADGRRYLDAYNNVPHVGHAHPAVVAAVQEQLAVLNTNTRYLQDVHAEYVEHLLATFPAPLSVCYLTASGSEATELALRLARARTGCRDLLVLDAAYHGHTTTAIDISPYKHEGPGGGGAPPWVHKTPLPDVYRGVYRAPDPEAGRKYAAAVGERHRRHPARGPRPVRLHRRDVPERRRTADAAAGVSGGGVPPGARGRRRGHRRRGADGPGAHRHALLGVRGPRRRARHRRAGQAAGQRLPDGRRRDHAGDRGGVRHRHGVLQHVRREQRGLRRGAGDAAGDDRRGAAWPTRAWSAAGCSRPCARCSRGTRSSATCAGLACSSVSSWCRIARPGARRRTRRPSSSIACANSAC